MPDPFTAITINLYDGPQVLVRVHADGEVEVDQRPVVRFGPRVWTPVGVLGGSFTVTRHENVDYGAAS